MHRKNIVSALFFIALPWVTQPVCLASTPRLAATRAPKAQLEQRRPGLRKKVSRSPFDRVFAPGFEKHLARAEAARAGARRSLKNSAGSFASSTANFSGFLSAPLFNGELRTACITDPYNCGTATGVSGDFNKDGKQDIATLEYDGTLNILLNDGAGGLQLPLAYGAATAAANFFSVASAQVADVNNDGYPDVVALDVGGNQFLVYLNQGDGTFAEPLVVASPADGSAGAMAVGDVNHDGNLDVVVISYNSIDYTDSEVTVQTFLGSGDGAFANPSAALTTIANVPALTEIESNGLALADVNHDGSLDLVTVLENLTSQTTGQIVVRVALGNDRGAFAGFPSSVPVIVVDASASYRLFLTSGGVYAVDLNNDGKLDLALSGEFEVLTALGNGDGTFQNAVEAMGGNGVDGSFQLAFADVNGDGYVDLINNGYFDSVYPGRGDGTFGPALGNYISSGGGTESMALVDLNGDGVPDLVAVEGTYRRVSVLDGRGDGTYIGAPMLSSPSTGIDAGNLTLEVAADVTGDGNTDAVEVNQPFGQKSELVTGISDGKGTFNYVPALPDNEFPDHTFVQPVAADFNGDGKQDIVISGPFGALWVALSNGDGSFQTPVAITLGALDCEQDYAAVGDLQHNGKPSIIVTYPGDSACGSPGSTPSGFFVVAGNGDGTFGTPQFQPFGGELYSAILADINGDGLLDLVLNDAPFDGAASFGVYYLPGNGDGTFGASATVSIGYMVSQVMAGDYNQDGTLDLIALTEGQQSDRDPDTTAGILLYPGHGDGTFGAVTELATGNFFLNGVFTDINGDGIPDITASLYTLAGMPQNYQGLSTFLGAGGGTFSAPVDFLAPLESESVFIGNFLADNAPDIALQTPYGTALFLNQGGTTLTLTASANTITQGNSVTFAATIQSTLTNRPSPTGTVTFLANGISVGSAPLSAGSAAVTIATLGAGANQISASYSGDAHFSANTQGSAVSVNVTALPPAITLASHPSAVTRTSGSLATTTLNLVANATFSGSVTLSTASLPQNVHAVLAPATVTLSAGQAATATLVFSGTQNPVSVSRRPFGFSSLAVVGLAGLLFVTVPAQRKRRVSALWRSVSLLLLMGAMQGWAGCGGSSSSSTKTSHTYNLQVAATPADSSVNPQTLFITLTVQN
jgi:hypothetical protein